MPHRSDTLDMADRDRIEEEIERAITEGVMDGLDIDLPRGPGGRNAAIIVGGIRGIEGAEYQKAVPMTNDVSIEFRMPDPDFKFPSSVNIDNTTGRITEATIRLGSLGNRTIVDRMEQGKIEGQFNDVALDAASDVGILDIMHGESVDLGDAYVSEKIRPHVRLFRKEDGYDISPREFVHFIDALASRFDSRFGTLEDRMMDPEFADRFRR